MAATALAAASIKANCRKVVCIGRNYAAHITELRHTTPKQPFFFLKPPSSILLPGAGAVKRPRGSDLHYEVELGVVIGRRVRDLSADGRGPDGEQGAWLGSIAAYVLAIDMTARNIQEEAKAKGLPWTIAKGFDTFLPISAPIAKQRLPDPHNARIWLSVNDNTHQDDNTELMLFKIPRLLSDISQVMALEEGDIVLTGTPKGVGPVAAGDVLKTGLEVDGSQVPEAGIEVAVEDSDGVYEFRET